jgi:hypothetical protein
MFFSGQRWRTLAIVTAGALALACGPAPGPAHPDVEYEALASPSARPPASEVERAILVHLGDLDTGNTAQLEGRTVVIGPPYAAASGRSCRRITIGGGSAADAPQHVLACLIAGAWSFVPAVVGDGDANGAGAP